MMLLLKAPTNDRVRIARRRNDVCVQPAGQPPAVAPTHLMQELDPAYSIIMGILAVVPESAPEAKHFVGRYIAFYNSHRPHSSLGGQTPDAVYFNQPTEKAA